MRNQNDLLNLLAIRSRPRRMTIFTWICYMTILFIFAVGVVFAAVITGGIALAIVGAVCAIAWGAIDAVLIIIHYRRKNRSRW